jgi:hypothetical protein
MWKCAGEATAFRRATRDVAAAQCAVLAEVLYPNRHSVYGTAHGFGRIRDARDYQERVPLITYADVAGLVERIAAGEPNVLTCEPVQLLEPTSGTTGGEKLIPSTATLRRQFQRGVAAWVAGLFHCRPAVRRGRAYWSISPALGPPGRTAGGIPVGFLDDAAYLGRLEQWALRHLLAVPSAVARLPDLQAVRYATLLFLLAADDLSLISLWNPSFLTALLTPLPGWLDRLCCDLARGSFDPPAPVRPECSAPLRPWLRALPRRAERLRAIFRSARWPAEALRQAWPRLALISCWADAAARHFLPELRQMFPGVEVQPKGLLATEGFVSLPLVGREGAALAVRSHFFEFEEIAPAGAQVRLAHELDRGGRYRVVLTTGGGLYRYQLRDEVEVVGFENRCPLLRFLGKADRVSDLVGEKLAEGHVQAVLERVFAATRLTPRFALLVPVLREPPRYRLYLEGPDRGVVARLGRLLQAELEENPYYRHAVAFGQLAPVEVRLLDRQGEPAWSVYERRCVERGQKAGDVKPAVLDGWTGWPDLFEPGAGRHT